MADKRKKYAWDVRSRTGWSYAFCLMLNDALGYEAVSAAVDAGVSGDELNARASAARKEKAGS